MKPFVARLVVLAAALAVVPAVAEEQSVQAKPAQEVAASDGAAPSATAAPAHDAVETLQRLRLHPGQDSLDLSETARRRPHPASE